MDEAPKSDVPVKKPPNAISFLLPTYKTPLLTGELLHTAAHSGEFAGCQFVLLLDLSDPYFLAYRGLVASVREKGLNAGYFVFDGTPYCGTVNRAAPILDTECVCVIDSKHLPLAEGGDMAGKVRRWLASSAQQMRVGTFTADGSYPVVTRKLVDRLGYMFHPLAYGREDAENWLLALGNRLDIVSEIPGGKVVVSQADGAEIVGESEDADILWVGDTLAQILEDEAERLGAYLIG